MRFNIHSALFVGIFLTIIISLCAVVTDSPAQTTPVEITAVRLTWVSSQSNVSPKERGEKSFWKGGRSPVSSEISPLDRRKEVNTSGNWGKIDVEFTTYRTWEDSIEFVFYFLLKDRDGFKMLKGSTTALYVAQGKGHYVVMYVYPNAIARYGGDVQAIAVQAVINGKIVSSASEPKTNKPWWEEYSPITGAIIDWIYTPMGRAGVDGYELIKITK